MALNSNRVISGTFGELWHDGEWLTNVTGVEANVEIMKEDVPRAGTRWMGKKVMSIDGTGTVTGYFVTSDLIEQIGSIADDRGGEFVTQLIVKLDDPDAFGAYRVLLKSVSFDSIPLSNYTVGQFVEIELPFTFQGYTILDAVHEN